MSENTTQKNWIVILTILLLAGMVIAGPLTTGQVGPEAHPIELSLPISINGSGTLTLTGLQIVGGLAALIMGGIAVVGAFLAFIFSRAERDAANTKNSESYHTHTATLEQQAADQIKQMRAGRQTDSVPAHQRPRWSTVSTSAVIILLAAFMGMLLNNTFLPDGEMMVNGRTASAISVILLWLALISLFIIIWRNQAAKARASEGGASWDTVWVVASGLLVVGVGVSLVIYFAGNPDGISLVNSAVPIVGGLSLISFFILALRVHPQRFTAIEQTDYHPIPWDFIWVLISGLIVVGLGLALVIYFNTPG